MRVGERRAATATSLAGYDMRYLEAWYRSLTASKGKGQIWSNSVFRFQKGFNFSWDRWRLAQQAGCDTTRL